MIRTNKPDNGSLKGHFLFLKTRQSNDQSGIPISLDKPLDVEKARVIGQHTPGRISTAEISVVQISLRPIRG